MANHKGDPQCAGRYGSVEGYREIRRRAAGRFFNRWRFLWWRFAYHRLRMYRRLFRLRYDHATRVSTSCVAGWYMEAALRSEGSLTTGYACIVALQAPIRPRYAGLHIVCSRLVHGCSPTFGRFAYHSLRMYRRLAGSDTTTLRESPHRV